MNKEVPFRVAFLSKFFSHIFFERFKAKDEGDRYTYFLDTNFIITNPVSGMCWHESC